MVAAHEKTQKRSARGQRSRSNDSGISPGQPQQQNTGHSQGGSTDRAGNPPQPIPTISSEASTDDQSKTAAVELEEGRGLKVAPDPRTVKGACVRIPSGDRCYVEGVDPKDSKRVLVQYESGLGTDSYPLHLLTLVHESPEQANVKRAIAPTSKLQAGDRVICREHPHSMDDWIIKEILKKTVKCYSPSTQQWAKLSLEDLEPYTPEKAFPKFKVGDRVRDANDYHEGVFTVTQDTFINGMTPLNDAKGIGYSLHCSELILVIQWQRGDRFRHTQTQRIGTILEARIEAKLNQEPERQLVVSLDAQDGKRGVRKVVWNLAEVEQWLVKLDDDSDNSQSVIIETLAELITAREEAVYTSNFLSPDEADHLFEFSQNLDWQHNSFSIFGKQTMLPRLEIMFGDAGCSYRYGNVTLEPLPWTPELQALRERVEAATGCKYQVVIGNLYRSGSDHIGWHSDDSPEMGTDPAIASISLGATRRFDVRRNETKETQSFELESGDLIFMPSGFQATHKHRVAKTAKETGIRINWTFRPHIGAAIAPSPLSLRRLTQLEARITKTAKETGIRIPSTPTEIVPADPQQRLTQLEADIQSGLDLVEQGKAQIWQAVAQIQADRLWEIQGCQSFEEYGKKRWGWEKANTYEVASAGRVVTELKQSGVPDSELPTSVSQTRELAKLPSEKRPAALKQAAEATDGKPTAKAIREAAQTLEPIVCKPSITPEEFNREMAVNSNQFSGCHSCTHQRLTGQGDRYRCEMGEFDEGINTLPLKQNWFEMNEGCKSYSKPTNFHDSYIQEAEAAIAAFPQSLEDDGTPCYYKTLFTSALKEWARAKGRDLDIPAAMQVVLENLEAIASESI